MITKNVSREFWKSKRVLVTGHTGFKGSWLSLWLQSLGADVSGLSLEPNTSPSLFVNANVDHGMNSKFIDIRKFDDVLKYFSSVQPEIVIHLAAQPLVRESYRSPLETYHTNVMGTVHVLEASRLTRTVKSVVNVTTDKCYENKEWDWGYRENEPMGGDDPYSSSKACSELVSSAYIKSFFNDAGVKHATARAGNVIGGGDWSDDRLIPDLLKSLQSELPVNVRFPKAIRPWQHVLEPLSGYLLLSENLYQGRNEFVGPWNFGPLDTDCKSVEWIVSQMFNIWGGGNSWSNQPGEHPHEANMLKLDISKARNHLNWHPRWDLKTALHKVTDWHKAWMSGESIKQMCLQQILEYTSCESLTP